MSNEKKSVRTQEKDGSLNKKPKIPRKNEVSLVRSSAAEYLTFVAASGYGGVEAVYADENVWVTQKMMGLLYDVETHTIIESFTIKGELDLSRLAPIAETGVAP